MKINVEFISANPTGNLHLGHGRGAFLGNAIANLYTYLGHQVTREYWINDSGKQIDALRNGRYATAKTQDEIQKENQDFIENVLKIHFDVWSRESQLNTDGILSVLKTYQKDGATWWEDKVLIKRNSEKTYFLKDIAYLLDKKRRGFDKMICVLGADHYEYTLAMNKVANELGCNAEFIITQLMTDEGEKFSKRNNKVVWLKDLLADKPLDEVKWMFLTRDFNTHFDFNIGKEITDGLYRLQYAHARCCGILKKANKQGVLAQYIMDIENTLLDEIKQWDGMVSQIAKTYSFPFLINYLLRVASSFNAFYEQCRVIGDMAESERIGLVGATKQVLRDGLNILGITAPERL